VLDACTELAVGRVLGLVLCRRREGRAWQEAVALSVRVVTPWGSWTVALATMMSLRLPGVPGVHDCAAGGGGHLDVHGPA
jgi:hypothetical protein